MALFYKKLAANQREMYLYYPGTQARTPFKRCSLTILMECCTRADVERALEDWGLRQFADYHEVILSFPVPSSCGWNDKLLPSATDDLKDFERFQDALSKPDDVPLAVNEAGIPTLEAMLCAWHPMNDTRYVIGIGSGASMALTLAACRPGWFAAVLAIGGALSAQALEASTYAPMPLCVAGTDADTLDYFCKANQAERISAPSYAKAMWASPIRPWQAVIQFEDSEDMSAPLLQTVWEQMLSQVRRVNTSVYGDAALRTADVRQTLECHIDDPALEDGHKHTWFIHVPARVRANSELKVPLVVFFHGGSDNPSEAAEMSKFHELGERDGFITVYPWATNHCFWNNDMLPSESDDVRFSALLIDHLIACYPIDRGRVYLSGFSNGAAQAMAVALLHPDQVAAICPIDSNWPGRRGAYQDMDYHQVVPLERGIAMKAHFDYRMPVWYIYGGREPSYPIYRRSSQQHQYDYWKKYNHIPVKPTPEPGEPNPTGCGVTGDVSETLYPSACYPHHRYDVQRFFSNDEPALNLYNYVVMCDKGHEVAPMDAELGWNYVRQFRRETDGRLTVLPALR